MAIVLSIILHVVLSIVSGLDADDWRKKIVKRLLSLEELNVHLQEEKKIFDPLFQKYNAKTLLKRDLQCFRYI